MDQFLAIIKNLVPVLEPLGEQGIEQLFVQVVDPYIASLSDSSDTKRILVILSPAIKQIMIIELQQLK